jgi:hypothetical protein
MLMGQLADGFATITVGQLVMDNLCAPTTPNPPSLAAKKRIMPPVAEDEEEVVAGVASLRNPIQPVMNFFKIKDESEAKVSELFLWKIQNSSSSSHRGSCNQSSVGTYYTLIQYGCLGLSWKLGFEWKN